MRFLHTMIRVKDAEKSLEFYEKLIGLRLDYTMDLDDCRLYFLTDGEGYTQLELTSNFDTPKDGYTEGSKFGHLAFETENFESVEKTMKELGVEYLYNPYTLGSDVIAFIKDPDGNEIELIKKPH